jgi:hypothetical protein
LFHKSDKNNEKCLLFCYSLKTYFSICFFNATNQITFQLLIINEWPLDLLL